MAERFDVLAMHIDAIEKCIVLHEKEIKAYALKAACEVRPIPFSEGARVRNQLNIANHAMWELARAREILGTLAAQEGDLDEFDLIKAWGNLCIASTCLVAIGATVYIDVPANLESDITMQ